MKQIPLTPAITAWLEAAVGPEVDVSTFAVFESISLNDRPLPGKRGRLFHGAVVPSTTLLAMVKNINGGNSLPLMIDHNLEGAPKGRVFHAALNMTDEGVEFRTLFYIDPTETQLIAKVNNGTYDEVSVSFLSEKILCSECGFDYRGDEATWENLLDMTCNEGHKVGEDGIHVRLIGLEDFIELSLVARGAADKPKIVGKSSSKIAPATAERLAAQGFENLDGLICQASLGEENVTVDVNKLIADLGSAQGELKVRDATITTLTAERDDAITARDEAITAKDAAEAAVAAKDEELTAAKANSKADEAEAAVDFLSTVLKRVRTAAGKEEGEVPTTVTDLTAAIKAETSDLTAILPVNGVGDPANNKKDEDEAKPSFAAYKVQ